MDTKRKELGDFLQALRQRGTPEEFGFPAGQRRRTKGLRREEVAQLAGISATWYTWIEQGRQVNVSADVLDRLAGTLKLSRSERAYLFDMADRRDPHGSEAESDDAPPHLTAMLTSIAIPAYILGRTWDLLAWNLPAAALFAGWLDQWPATGPRPNLLRFVFQHQEARQFVADWDLRARRLVAEFRADCRSRLEEPAIQRLIGDLAQASPEFERFWKQHDVLERQGGQRTFNHPHLGVVSYHQVTLRPVEQEQIKLVLLSPCLDG